jgi:chromosome segregation ATPase
MATKYQVTELDRALEQFKRTDEWTNEKQLEWQLRRSEESAIKQLQRMAEEKAELYTDNVLLKRDIEVLKTQLKKGKDLISKLQKREETHKHIVPNLQAWRDRHADTIKEYDNLKSECHSDIEKVWMFDATLTKDLSAYHKRKRSEAIERVFYKIANQWID